MITDVAIIGGGFSGTMLATHLLMKETSLRIAIIEKSDNIFKGTAYGTKDDGHLLNVPAYKMTAFPDAPNHFVDWLRQNGHDKNGIEKQFLPRAKYGRYLNDNLLAAEKHSASQLDIINDNVIDIEQDESTYKVISEKGNGIVAKKVVMAMGNFPPSNPPLNCNQDIYNCDLYISNPWDLEKVWNIKTDEDVLIIGSGLTMLDMLVTLKKQNHQGMIHVISRRGMIPKEHETHDITEFNMMKSGALSKRLQEFKRKSVDNWRGAIDSFRPFTQRFWQELTLFEKKQFLRHLRPFWDVHRHRVAPEIMQIYNEYKTKDQLVLHAGYIQKTHLSQENIVVEYKPRGKSSVEKITIKNVINCTGPNHNLKRADVVLIKNLEKKNMISQSDIGMGFEITEEHTNIHVIGGAQIGQLWETTAVPELRVQAQMLAQTLLA